MKIDQLEYFWGLFDDPTQATAAGAKKHLCLVGEEISAEIQSSFVTEEIYELRGEFGVGGVGQPEEVDHLNITVEGKSWQVRVLNHGISMFHASSPELVRLLRFFVVLTREADQQKPK